MSETIKDFVTICFYHRAGPYGAFPGTNPFQVPHFLFIRARLQFPRPSGSTKGQIQIVAIQKSEERQKQRRNRQETVGQWWGRVLGPPEEIDITISLYSSAGTKSQDSWNTASLPHHQPIRRKSHTLQSLPWTTLPVKHFLKYHQGVWAF